MAAMTSLMTLAARTQIAARDYVELLALRPKDKAAHKEAHARYKAAQAEEIKAVTSEAKAVTRQQVRREVEA